MSAQVADAPSHDSLYRHCIQAVTHYVQQNIHRPFTLVELADVAGFSPYHFHRIFAGMTGETVGVFVRRQRLELAAGQLEFTPKSVTRIAKEACYDSLEAFSRAFKTHFGLTPSAFREMAPSKRQNRLETQAKQSCSPRPHARRDTPMDVSILTKAPLRVACMRATGPYMESSQEAWTKLLAWAGPHGLLGPQAVYLGIGYDDPGLTAPEKLRYDACLSVSDAVAPEGDVSIMDIPGGEFAVHTHIGPYEELEKVYVALYGQWLPASGRMPAMRPSFEVYLNSPESTPPHQLRTRIHIPLEPQTPE